MKRVLPGWRRCLSRSWVGMAVLAFLTPPLHAELVTIDFEGFPPGQVVVGEMPDGSVASPALFPYVIFSVESYGSHNSLVIFDSSNPTGGDYDLGSPNKDFGGPGLGEGGNIGMPGQNDSGLGHVLIIAEQLTDLSPTDGLVDSPDDDSHGGLITARFPFGVTVEQIKLLDMDLQSRGSWIKLYADDNLLLKHAIEDLGNNSVQEVQFDSYDSVTRMEVFFRGPGAIDDLRFSLTATAIDVTTWGRIKRQYR